MFFQDTGFRKDSNKRNDFHDYLQPPEIRQFVDHMISY